MLQRNLLFSFSFLLFSALSFSQASFVITDTTLHDSTKSVEIVRDQWGVPHVYGKTDKDVAYGLGWVQCEDDFETFQRVMAPIKGLSGRIEGKDGAIKDFIVHLFNIKGRIEQNYDELISDEFKPIISSYVKAVNAFAKSHPKEILHKRIFPITEQDMIGNYMLALAFMTWAHVDVTDIFKDYININDMENLPEGSNGFAFSSKKMKDKQTVLVSNSHQPIQGPYSWYEAHLSSQEGWEILGATFAGGLTMFSGVTPNIAWCHTLNSPDLSDVFHLQMHPKEKLMYKFNGKYLKLEERPITLKVNAGPITIPIKRKTYWSVYGPVLENKKGFFAIRYSAMTDFKAAEQWYFMNKSKNFEEFKTALDIQGLSGMNIVYADAQDNIYYLGNGKIPYRNVSTPANTATIGDSSYTLWDFNFYPIDSLPHVKNPSCGYVFSHNHGPFLATCDEDNFPVEHEPKFAGYLKENTNRSLRAKELIESYDLLTYEDVKKIKYDRTYPSKAFHWTMRNVEDIFHLDTVKYSKIKEMVASISNWDREMDLESYEASIVAFTFYKLIQLNKDKNAYTKPNTYTEAELVGTLEEVKAHLLKHFGTIKVPLKEIQFLVRGEEEFPFPGGPDVLAPAYTKPYKKDLLQVTVGDSYIQFVQFMEGKPVIESINIFGSSNHKESKHYKDQLPLFLKDKLKTMTLDKKEIYRNAEKVYSLD